MQMEASNRIGTHNDSTCVQHIFGYSPLRTCHRVWPCCDLRIAASNFSSFEMYREMKSRSVTQKNSRKCMQITEHRHRWETRLYIEVNWFHCESLQIVHDRKIILTFNQQLNVQHIHHHQFLALNHKLVKYAAKMVQFDNIPIFILIHCSLDGSNYIFARPARHRYAHCVIVIEIIQTLILTFSARKKAPIQAVVIIVMMLVRFELFNLFQREWKAFEELTYTVIFDVEWTIPISSSLPSSWRPSIVPRNVPLSEHSHWFCSSYELTRGRFSSMAMPDSFVNRKKLQIRQTLGLWRPVIVSTQFQRGPFPFLWFVEPPWSQHSHPVQSKRIIETTPTARRITQCDEARTIPKGSAVFPAECHGHSPCGHALCFAAPKQTAPIATITHSVCPIRRGIPLWTETPFEPASFSIPALCWPTCSVSNIASFLSYDQSIRV